MSDEDFRTRITAIMDAHYLGEFGTCQCGLIVASSWGTHVADAVIAELAAEGYLIVHEKRVAFTTFTPPGGTR